MPIMWIRMGTTEENRKVKASCKLADDAEKLWQIAHDFFLAR